MTSGTITAVKTLGDYAYQAIKKHLKKTLKWETSVKKDEDPEALHQMRVGMRRLRTAISSFAPALNLPKPVSDKNIGKIARRLGNLRDLDVLKYSLENFYQPHLPPKEQKNLQATFDVLSKQREDALADVQETLKEERYKSLKQSLKEWLDEPKYQPLASLSIQQVLPDLLLPEVSRFMLHPGWLVGTEIEDTEVIILKDLEPQKVEQQLAVQGESLHSLRKEAKRLRYQMELFSDLYNESFAAFITEVKSIQEILGQMQDSVVLAEWLNDALEGKIQTQLPTLANLFAKNRYHLWQKWQPVQERYLKAENRQVFHLTILHQG